MLSIYLTVTSLNDVVPLIPNVLRLMREWYPIIITSVFTALAVTFKLLSRRDGDISPFRNDFYIAQALFMGSVSALAVYLVKSIISGNSEAALACSLLLFLYILVSAALACLDRWFAWESSGGIFRRKWPLGIWVPNLLGAFGYFAVFFFAKSRHL